MSFNNIPSYIVAADNHAVANGDESSSVAQGIIGAAAGFAAGAAAGGGLLSVITAPLGAYIGYNTAATNGKFLEATTLSAANSLYNSGISLYNLLPGEDADEAKLQDWMQAMDDDLYSYYEQNKQFIDVNGFVVSSIVPGTIGLKIYNRAFAAANAAKYGKLGINMSEATGLLGGTQQHYLQLAAKELAAIDTGGQFLAKALNANTIKALAAGAGEQIIQNAVFEAAALALNFKSPVLEGQDASDIFWNSMHGLAFGAAIGTGISTVASFGTLKSALRSYEKDLRPFEFRDASAPGSDTWHKLMINKVDEYTTPTTFDGIDPALLPKAESLLADKIRKLNTANRQLFQELANKDALAANTAYDYLLASRTSMEDSAHVLQGLKAVSNITVDSAAVKEAKLIRKRINKGDKLKPAEYDALNIKSLYLQTWGDNQFGILDELSTVKNIQDTLKPGQRIKITGNKVTAGDQVFKVASTKVGAAMHYPFDPVAAFKSEGLHSIQARELWAMSDWQMQPKQVIDFADTALLRKAIRQFDTVGEVQIKGRGTITNREELIDTLEASIADIEARLAADGVARSAEVQVNAISKYLGDVRKLDPQTQAFLADFNNMSGVQDKFKALTTNEIAAITGRRLQGYEGYAAVNDRFMELSAFDYYKDKAIKAYAKLKERPNNQLHTDVDNILLQPQHIRLDYDTGVIPAVDTKQFLDEGLAILRSQQKVLQEAADRAAAPVLAEFNALMPEFPAKSIMGASREGGSQTVLGFADQGYFSVGSITQRIGVVANKLKISRSNTIKDNLTPLLLKLDKDTDATLELSTLINKVRSTPDQYVLDSDIGALRLKGIVDYEEAIAAGVKDPKPYIKIKPDAEEVIPINSELVRDIVINHMDFNAERIAASKNLRGARGIPDNRDGSIVYFGPENARDYPYFALVVEKDSLTKTYHKKMIYAASEVELEQLINRVPSDKFNVIKKADGEAWKKAVGEYQDDLALHDNYMNAELFRSGASAPFFPKTNAERIIKDLESWHIRSEHNLVEEAIATKYFKEFNELDMLGERLTSLATTQHNRLSLFKGKSNELDNPFRDYINQALDRPKHADIPLYAQQYGLDKAVSKIWNAGLDMLSKTKSVTDLDKVNEHFTDAGINTGYYDASMELLANHSVERGALSTFVRRANGILAALAIRTDVFNAINNTIGLGVLYGTEMHAIREALKGNSAAMKEFSAIGKVLVPGTDDYIMSPAKLMSTAINNFFKPERRAWALQQGFTMRHVAEMLSIHDDLAWGTLYTANDINGKLGSAYNKAMKFVDTAELLTGNKLAEEFTRFIAADTMRQITDIGVKHGVISTKAANAAIGTFVNRTTGNYLASQRPLMFHGPVGQAVGLFQTYQVNLIQQLFRHIAEGQKKSAAIMMALQGSIYGLNGLPGFQAFNTRLVGSASGNTDNTDIYKVMYNQQDKTMADFLMYGFSANMFGLLHPDLKTNIYNRGDINPRHLTIIPTSISDIPIASATTKFFGNLKQAMSTATSGSPWQAFVQGLEHNGVSRPLAGIGQLIGGIASGDMKIAATGARGDLRAANDVLALTSLVRLAGAKPLDEAIISDMEYRSQVYRAKRNDRVEELGIKLKSKLIRGEELDDDDVTDFAASYVKAGGKQEQFNRWMMKQSIAANAAQANRIADDLKRPDAQLIQRMMGGGRMQDFAAQ